MKPGKSTTGCMEETRLNMGQALHTVIAITSFALFRAT